MVGDRCHNQEKKPFEFEAMWVGERECANIIENNLRCSASQNTIGEVIQMISKCGEIL